MEKKHSIIFLYVFITTLVFLSSSYAATTFFQYDDFHRLTQVEHSDGTVIVYQYDTLGNRTSKVVSSPIMATFTGSPSAGRPR